MITGRCHCGAIRYQIHGTAIKRADCDCPDCQRATGAEKAPFLSFHPDQVHFTRTQPAQFQAQDGQQCDRHGGWLFCPQCGTKLLWFSHQGDLYDVLLGTIDDRSVVRVAD